MTSSNKNVSAMDIEDVHLTSMYCIGTCMKTNRFLCDGPHQPTARIQSDYRIIESSTKALMYGLQKKTNICSDTRFSFKFPDHNRIMDRKAELEKKKAKLAALREEKERRRREKEAKDMEDASGRIGSNQEKDTRR